MRLKYLFLCLMVITKTPNAIAGIVDIVVFSYDRPIQLYALLESMEHYFTGMHRVTVIYRASNIKYQTAYSEVSNTFSFATFVQQSNKPSYDFKPLTIQASHFDDGPSYIMYAVDDIIVKDYVDFHGCINTLERTHAYGFYLRLGVNLTDGYPPGVPQKQPYLQRETSSILSWQFQNAEGDWTYPHTLDMTIYRKADIADHICKMQYRAPNLLEAEWSGKASSVMHKRGLCFSLSKMVNIPMNIVQDCGWQNAHMNFKNSEELLELFNQRKKIDITSLHQVENKGSHWNYIPNFISR